MASPRDAKPRILILDWDVHHCDGTEKIFFEDPSVLVVSIHQHGSGRGHVLRKMPSAKFHESQPRPPEEPNAEPKKEAGEQLDFSAICRLMDGEEPCDHVDGTTPEHNTTLVVKGEEQVDILEMLPREGRRARQAVDYNLLEQQLHIMDDRDALAALGVREEANAPAGNHVTGNSSQSSSSSSSSSSSGSSTTGSSSGACRPVRQAESIGLSQDSFQEEGVEGEVEEPFYPGTGFIDRVGGEVNTKATGRNVNIPWPAHGMGDMEYTHVLQAVVLPIACEFEPELVFISCGFDSARGDTLGSMSLSPTGFYIMTKLLCTQFPKLVVALEGGYSPTNVALCSEAVTRALLEASGSDPTQALPPSRMLWCQTEGLIQQVRRQQAPYWSCMRADT
ncbi:histone deacetylase [Strigomonas culicis]|uniref:Histone deacetylase n=1 Tax=Strigomonas culicis TaxID=28005 RepID=S9UIT7_9TRYP|nr:histone deacetylase [Strigomonas culicis]|eukprot:EPY28878.1 histone deacetylase [Strigomonas culicis]